MSLRLRLSLSRYIAGLAWVAIVVAALAIAHWAGWV